MKMLFDVTMRQTRTEKFMHIRYVRAEDEKAASRIAVKVDREVFGYKNTYASSVRRGQPINLVGGEA